MNIPSNFSNEEIVKYVSMPEEARVVIEQLANELISWKEQVRSFSKLEEQLHEQIYFRDTFIEQVIEACKTTTKHKDLVKYIKNTLAESYIEL
jgi:hypothetical protein